MLYSLLSLAAIISLPLTRCAAFFSPCSFSLDLPQLSSDYGDSRQRQPFPHSAENFVTPIKNPRRFLCNLLHIHLRECKLPVGLLVRTVGHPQLSVVK